MMRKKIEVQAQKERKQFIVRLAVAGLGMMQTMMFALPTYFYGGDIEPLLFGNPALGRLFDGIARCVLQRVAVLPRRMA